MEPRAGVGEADSRGGAEPDARLAPRARPVVLDEDGEPLEASSELADPDEVGDQEEPAFWEDAWASVVLAGRPPADDGTPPLTEIDPGTDGAPE